MSTQISISPIIKLEVNTTPITGGSAGQVLFQTTSNTVGESANLFWDDTNGRLGIGTSSPSFVLDVNGVSRIRTFQSGTPTILNIHNQETNGLPGGAIAFYTGGSSSSASRIVSQRTGPIGESDIALETTGVKRLFVTATSGNIGINTTTDAGFRLDVNGTARVATSLEVAGATGVTLGGGASALAYSGNVLNIGNSASWTDIRLFAGGVQKFSQTSTLSTISNTTINLSTATVQLAGVNALTYSGTDIRIGSVAAGFNSLSMYVAGSERARIASTGNVLINTTTDAGFKLDVDGSMRGTNGLTLTGGLLKVVGLAGAGTAFTIVDDNGSFIRNSTWNYDRVTLNTWVGGTQQASSVFTLNSTTKGFLPPKMTNAQMLAIATPVSGLMVYDTTNNKLCCYDGTTWQNLF